MRRGIIDFVKEQIMIEIKGTYTTAKVMIDQIDDTCRDQIQTFVNSKHFTEPVAIMPDTHAGKGSVIGFTMPITKAIIPNVIGVDIGCGMLSAKIGKELPLELEELDCAIRKRIPFGMETHQSGIVHMKDEFPWERVKESAEKFADHYKEQFGIEITPPEYDHEWFLTKCDQIGGSVRRYINSLGTLGGGNHFIETGIDDDKNYWFTIHSGSRNFGKMVCDYWQNRAFKRVKERREGAMKKKIDEFYESFVGSKSERKAAIAEIKKEYSYAKNALDALFGDDAAGYLFDMIFAQVYASVNRQKMMEIIGEITGADVSDQIETVHNYIDFEDFIIRKGAIRSYKGERMIIPFNMRDGILLCEGKSNSEWNCSAPHGAGRVMSRSQARRELDVEKFKKQMDGIYSTSVGDSTIDEAPDSYKPAAIIEEAIADTATIITRIKPVHNMKDTGDSGFPRRRKKR